MYDTILSPAQSLTMSTILHNQLRSLRERIGWSQQRLADATGLSRAAISAIETGRVAPSTAAALALAATLGVTVESIFQLEATSPGEARWAWAPPAGDARFWEARIGGRMLRYPVEAIALGALPHDGLGGSAVGGAATGAGERRSDGVAVDPARTLVLAGCDPAVGVLAAALVGAGIRLVPFTRASRASLELLRQGVVHVAGLHLGGGRGAADNERVVRELLGPGYALMRVARWQEGVALGPGLGLRTVGAAVRAKLRWVGREQGSGARRCLDLILEGRSPRPEGYNRLAADHRGVVETIRTGWAQAGVCVRLAAADARLDFLPVRRENYDLCFRADDERDPRIAALLDTVRSRAFHRTVAALPGYDARHTGELT